jgi:hypothetical protein
MCRECGRILRAGAGKQSEIGGNCAGFPQVVAERHRVAGPFAAAR